MKKHYVHYNGAAWFAKDGEYFESQPGGDWKRYWLPIYAETIEIARATAQRVFGNEDPLRHLKAAEQQIEIFKHPLVNQLRIALLKAVYGGYKPGDELWSKQDQRALEMARDNVKPGDPPLAQISLLRVPYRDGGMIPPTHEELEAQSLSQPRVSPGADLAADLAAEIRKLNQAKRDMFPHSFPALHAVAVKIKRVHPDAKIPTYGSEGAACFDLYPVEGPSIVYYGDPVTYDLGIQVEIPPGYAMFVYSRSGQGFNHSVRLANGTGIIDSDYRGNVMVKLTCDDPLRTLNGMPVSRDKAIAQAVVMQVPRVQFIEVDELSATERGEGGFGSTDAKPAVPKAAAPSESHIARAKMEKLLVEVKERFGAPAAKELYAPIQKMAEVQGDQVASVTKLAEEKLATISPVKSIPLALSCPKCGEAHIDEGEWATKPHRTHQCQACKHEWRPYNYHTVGVNHETIKAIHAAVVNAIASNSHPCDDGYLMFTDERELQTVCNQVGYAIMREFVLCSSVVNDPKVNPDREVLHMLRAICGYIENGSGESVTICQDDATGYWSLYVGIENAILNTKRRSYSARSFNEVIRVAAEKEGDKS